MSDHGSSFSNIDQRNLPISSGENITFRVEPSNIPTFIEKLFMMVNDQHIEEMITWSDNGESFIVLDIYEFSKVILPQYFKHNKWSSFVRQLNTYGFYKLTDYKNDNEKQTNEFKHPLFYRNGQHILHKIRRNMRQNNLASSSTSQHEFSCSLSALPMDHFTPMLIIQPPDNIVSSDLILTKPLITNFNDDLNNLTTTTTTHDNNNIDEATAATLDKYLLVREKVENLQTDVEQLQMEITSLKQTVNNQQEIIKNILSHLVFKKNGTNQTNDGINERVNAYLESFLNCKYSDTTISINEVQPERGEYNINTLYNHTSKIKSMGIEGGKTSFIMNKNNETKSDKIINHQEVTISQVTYQKINNTDDFK